MHNYPPYPAYKDSGVEWLGEIPAHWEAKRLKSTAKVITGQSPHESTYNDYGEGSLLINGPAEYSTDDFGRTRALKWTTDPKKYAPQDSLLFCLRGSTTGRLNIAHDNVSIGRGVAAIVANDSQSFLNYAMVAIRTYVLGTSKGSTFPSVTSENLGSYTVSVPTVFEQNQITAFLDRETAKIDALIEKKERLIELLQEQRSALITHAVTKGLDPDAPMKDSGVAWLGEIPAHWKIIRVGYFSKVGNGSTPNRTQQSYWEDGEIPWLTSGKVHEGIVRLADEFVTECALKECHLPMVAADSVLVAITGEGKTRGASALVKFSTTISQHLAYLTITDKSINSRFLYAFFNSQYEQLRRESSGSGSTRAALTCEYLKSVSVPIPPISEQEQIACLLDRETVKIDTLTAKVQEHIDHLKEYRTALVFAAVTGKIDVREEAPWAPKSPNAPSN